MKRKKALSRFWRRETPQMPPRQAVGALGPLAKARLTALDYELSWRGSVQFLELGAAESRLDSYSANLKTISAVRAEVGLMAAACNERITGTLGPAGSGRLADTLLLWPAYPEAFIMRAAVITRALRRLELEAANICTLAAALEETTHRWERFCRDTGGPNDMAARARIAAELLSESDFRLLTERAASAVEIDAVNRRIALAEDVIGAWRERGVALVASFEEELSSAEVQLEALLRDVVSACAIRNGHADRLIKTSSLVISEHARMHLDRLRPPSDRMLTRWMRKYFGRVVPEPLRTWTRLTQSKRA
jgi:hypothetical protein